MEPPVSPPPQPLQPAAAPAPVAPVAPASPPPPLPQPPAAAPLEPRLRDKLPLAPRREAEFRWRGNEVSRVEGLADAVFGFAVTLLVVALEVPRTYEGLMDVVRGFPAFVICFVLLMLFWNAHYRYHRRYGLEDVFTRVITMAILVLVLFFVYPLKFLFTFVTGQMFGIQLLNAPTLAGSWQVDSLYFIYGAGLAGTWGLYAALYAHAWSKRVELELNPVELLHTRSALNENLIYVIVCMMSIVLAAASDSDGAPGFVYFLLGPLQALNGWYYGRKAGALAKSMAQ
jgi:uncharacterized membrane protein